MGLAEKYTEVVGGAVLKSIPISAGTTTSGCELLGKAYVTVASLSSTIQGFKWSTRNSTRMSKYNQDNNTSTKKGNHQLARCKDQGKAAGLPNMLLLY